MSTHQTMPVSEALRHCGLVTRRCARNFYYGLKLTPEPQRSALFTLYAWMRRADDLVDNAEPASTQCLERIEAFRAATERALTGTGADDDPLWIALADVALRFDLQRDALYLMLDGQIDDLAGRHYETFEQVREYCYRVASSVGLLCINIWGFHDPNAPALAVDRGIAFQLTNMLRDYREDYDAGRIYLPAEDFAQHGLAPEELRDWSDPPRCAHFVRAQAARARSFYDRSASLDQMITPSCRPALWAMTAIYGSLLKKIEDEPAQIITRRRVRLGAWRKGMIAMRAKWFGHPTGNGSL